MSESIMSTPVSGNNQMMNFTAWQNCKPKQSSRFKFPNVSESTDAGCSKSSLVLRKLKAAMQELSAPKKEVSELDAAARDLSRVLESILDQLASGSAESGQISTEDITLGRLGLKYL